jgi:hypothetical protein
MEKNFKNLVTTLKDSIKTWEYFVNWEKTFRNSSEFEITLNKLNYLLGKADLKTEFLRLYASNPDIVRAIPVLLAVRENQFGIYDIDTKQNKLFDFSVGTKNNPDELYEFIEKSGLVKLFKEDGVKNLVDYVLGVEVGLDSNGRKNRGGTLMEKIVEKHIKDFCAKHRLEYLIQANAAQIFTKWGYKIEVDKSSRRFDVAIFNPQNKKIKLVETNFYNGGGSKLKAVCGEFKALYDELKRQDIDFVWVTDGRGWNSAKRPLEETYNHNDYVFNLAMVEQSVLEHLNW